MRKSTEIKKDLQTKMTAQRAIVEGAKDDTGAKRTVLNAEETISFDAAQTEIVALGVELTRATAYEENMRTAAAASGAIVTDGAAAEEKKIIKRYSLHRAVRAEMGVEPLSGVEAEMHEEVKRHAQEAGVNILGIGVPAAVKRADGQTVTQDAAANGGNLVSEDLGGVIEYLRPRPVVESVGARMITGLRGDVSFPTNDGGIVASWEGEVAEVSNSKNAYGKKSMKPNRLACSVLLSLQNVFQSSPDLEAMTVADINTVAAHKLDEAAINGAGTGNVPEGILNTSGIATIAAGANGLAPTWAHIIALETGIFNANADAERMAYIINTATKGKLKVTKHEAGDLGYLMSMANTINGYNVGVSNLVPSNLTKGSGTNLSAGIFGDFSQLLIGQWGFYDLSVDDKSRKKEGYIEITMNAFYDTLVRQAAAFAAVKDWVI
jgi:HK97 family phage major capsid protein